LEKHIPIDQLLDFNIIFTSLQHEDVRLNNDLLDSPLNPSLAQILQTQDYRSVMIVPILVQDELIGSLNLMAFNPHAFVPGQAEIGREVANQLGIVIRQAALVNQLRADQENLQALSQRLLGIQESERRKIARELHDEVGQALTGLGLILDMVAKMPADSVAGGLDQAHALVVELMERVSQLSLELRPALLDDLGLLPALLWYIDLYSSRTNITVSFKHSGLEEQRFAAEVETAAYRIVQEALTNVARHARVSVARVAVWFDQGVLGIQVEDEGVGFNPDAVLTVYNSSGLLGMRERAMLLNGMLTIESPPAGGTRLLAEIPVTLQDAKERDEL
jgi:signal transduction histidine kinase